MRAGLKILLLFYSNSLVNIQYTMERTKKLSLKEKLKYAGIKQIQIAEATGMSETMVNKVLNGERSSTEITSAALSLLKEVLSKDAGLTAFFKTRGV